MRNRHNPPQDVALAAIMPVLPYLAGGLVLYFFGDKILTFIGAKISGVNTVKYAKDAHVVTEAVTHPLITAKDLIEYATGTQTGSGVKVQRIKGKDIPVPFPNPASQEEFRANITAINAALGKTV